MRHDIKIDIATGGSARTKTWVNKSLTWSELVQKLSDPVVTKETHSEFIRMTKQDQGNIKDVGGYVGGYLVKGKRSPSSVLHRSVLTLDIDFANSDFWDTFEMMYLNAAVLHSTHKHHAESPRYRLVMPLSREVTADEYVAIARRVAGNLNIDIFDNTTFQPSRLMFWPSHPRDVEYYIRVMDAEILDADEVLSSYVDWKDSSAWPTAEKFTDELKTKADKQQDPENKKGIIGAFCRTYSISEAIEAFLQDEYVQASEDRYTYKKGSTAGGVVVYSDKFVFSHHGTDPISSTLCNAFDLVRIHKFGDLDLDAAASGSSAKSFKAMQEFASELAPVKKLISKETIESAEYDFADIEAEQALEAEDSTEWAQDLEIDKNGKILSTAHNIDKILSNDPRLAGAFRYNVFNNKRYVFKNMPWRTVSRPEAIKNVDYSGVRNYLEVIYGVTGAMKIDDSLAVAFERNSYHPVREYLTAQIWDGVARVDKLMVEYFGAPDNIYTREAIRKMLVAAVARIFKPGVKFDNALTLIGEQGTYKSTFLKKLGGDWFSDTFLTVSGKEALEQIQGAWLIEMAELSGLSKHDVESIKHFMSKQVDSFRPAYARTSEDFHRQCVFFGTTNNREFLKDPTGNRRFWPIDVDLDKARKSVREHLTQEEINQIWAEAVHLFRKGETLFLGVDAEKIARKEQREHSEVDDRQGLIEEFLEKRLPADWEDYDTFKRQAFYADPLSATDGTVDREYVCTAEIWVECLGKELDQLDRYKSRPINDIMKAIPGWKKSKSTRRFGKYGAQKYYYKEK